MTNPTQATLTCRLATAAPFSIIGVEANGDRTPGDGVITILPGQSLQVELAMDLSVDELNGAIASSVVVGAAAAAAAAEEVTLQEEASGGSSGGGGGSSGTADTLRPGSSISEPADEEAERGGSQIEAFPQLLQFPPAAAAADAVAATTVFGADVLVPSLARVNSDTAASAPPAWTIAAHPPAGSVRISDVLTASYTDGTSQTFRVAADIPRTAITPSAAQINFGTCLAGSTSTQTMQVGNFGRGHAGWQLSSNMGCFSCVPSSGRLEGFISKVSQNRCEVEVSYTPDGAGFFEAVLLLEGMLGEPSHKIRVFGQGTHDEGVGRF
jgi:hypothetical protein